MLGGMADLPLRLGGGPTPSEQCYQVLRKAVGKGGSADDDTGIEGLWRRSEAKGLAAAASHVRRAFIQSNPLFATDLIPYFERVLGITPPEGASEASRRSEIVPLWVRKIDASMPGVEAELVKLDPRFSLIDIPRDLEIAAMPGRIFGSESDPMVLPQNVSRVANYSSSFAVRVLFDLGYAGVPTQADQRILELARRKLRELVQSWETWTITTGPWVLGSTPIGLGTVG
jgi:hypothetical protein